MKVNNVTITFDNFGDAAMADDPDAEVCRILRGLADRLEQGDGIVSNFEGRHLVDVNGNIVGSVEVDWSQSDG